MTVVLSGGIDQDAAAPLASRVLSDSKHGADASATAVPVVGVLCRGTTTPLVLAELRAALGDGNCEVRELAGELNAADILALDALIITDGDASQLLEACAPVVSDIRGLIQRGASFWGIGAGAAIASEVAIIGGSAVGGVAVAPKLSTETTHEMQLAQGLGLVDITVLPQAAQLGRLGIGIAACEAGLIDRVVGLDANTSLVIAAGAVELVGSGSMWEITAGDEAVTVNTRSAEPL
nr:Type 1 glutamine amidotransferase-like domain-containing protein [Pseudoclavibacter sp. Marseille-Q3772]